MSPNRRIFLNIAATYGRSLYALVIGLFCGRWMLMVLGEVDYGLIGVVGALTAFVTFLNGIMSAGVGRFYAISVGEARNNPVEGLEKCREWFTTAVVIHSTLPVILLAIGYPLGEWAVRHYLTIPPDRVAACVWVWRFTCLSTFVGMVSVPYRGMYGAKQEIAEQTLYSFATSTANVFFLYYALTHPGDWLAKVAAWSCGLSVVPSLIISIRAFFKYPECRFRAAYVHCGDKIARMMKYSGWLVFGNLAAILGSQGIAVFLNKLFGPRVNAASAVGNTLSNHCQTLSGSLIGAFTPAIMNAYGEGDHRRFLKLSNLVNKVSTAMILVFAIPLALEIDQVLRLWLKPPPQYSANLCVLALAYAVVDKISWGCCIAVYAAGKMALYQVVIGGVFLFAIPIAFLFFKMGMGVYCAAWSLLALRVFIAVARVVIAHRTTGAFPVGGWVSRIVVPLSVVSIASIGAGCLPRLFLSPSFIRIGVTTLFSESVFLIFAWHALFDAEERRHVAGRFGSTIRKFARRTP